MPTTLMETNDDASGAEVPAGLKAMRDEIAAIQAEESGGAPEAEAEATGLGASLEAAGIQHEVKPKPEPTEAPPAEAPAEPESAGAGESEPTADSSGMDALTAALSGQERPSREERIQSRDELLNAASEHPMLAEFPGIAKALGNNVPREEAQKFLDSLASQVQSGPAGQPAQESSPVPPSGAAPTAALAEVQGALGDSLGEETAAVVVGLIEQANARAERAEAVAAQVSQAQVATQSQDLVTQTARDLEAQCPGILRGGTVDPKVGLLAADLYGGQGETAGDLGASMRVAWGYVNGGATESRQPSKSTQTTELPTPASAEKGTRYIEPHEFAQRSAAVARKHMNDPAKMEQAMSQLEREVRENNRLFKARQK